MKMSWPLRVNCAMEKNIRSNMCENVYGCTETTYKKPNDNEKGQCEQYEMDENEMENK
jgi:hypothetical protein